MHPLAEDYIKLTDVELQERINKIMKVLRSAQNSSVAQQAMMLRDGLIAEQSRRNTEMLEKLNKDRKLPDVINIS
jgi:hypothetical protein